MFSNIIQHICVFFLIFFIGGAIAITFKPLIHFIFSKSADFIISLYNGLKSALAKKAARKAVEWAERRFIDITGPEKKAIVAGILQKYLRISPSDSDNIIEFAVFEMKAALDKIEKATQG